ncbi:MAG: hypothetical protein FWC34_09365 [Bacteroidetes bacterium]|nr:hypothetical protein [Bacteroidota bacterium]MCL2302992.1 hypothetical protein [Lentimicrobiaceae bacterium]
MTPIPKNMTPVPKMRGAKSSIAIHICFSRSKLILTIIVVKQEREKRKKENLNY